MKQGQRRGSLERVVEERIGKNDSMFRAANERIAEFAGADASGEEEPIPFLCECADPTCNRLILLDQARYSEVRRNPRWFLNAPGHEHAALGAAVVVQEYDNYLIVEKTGRAGEVAEALADAGTESKADA